MKSKFFIFDVRIISFYFTFHFDVIRLKNYLRYCLKFSYEKGRTLSKAIKDVHIFFKIKKIIDFSI